MNGAEGLRFCSFFTIFDITKSLPPSSFSMLSDASLFGITIFSPSFENSFEVNVLSPSVARSASIDQYSCGMNFFISSSLSQINLTATDCTLPAERPFLIFFQRSGESLYPTILSSILLACWASTRFISISLGFSIACRTAFFVIALNSTRLIFASATPRTAARCQAIASPSLSGSGARYTIFAFFAAAAKALTAFSFPLMTLYLGSKSFSMLMPILVLGRSLM